MSRAGQSWGIPLPWDPSSVVYVWFDALINYASAVGLGHDPAMCERWWPADLHVIGKDITRFHTVIWPAMLMSANLPLPRQVFGHGFMTLNGQRMSKDARHDRRSNRRGIAVHPIRWLYLTKEIAFGNDGDFSWERYDERYNVDSLQQSWQPGQPRHRHGPPVLPGPTRACQGGRRSTGKNREQAAADYRRSMDQCRARRSRRSVSIARRDQRVHRRDRSMVLAEDPATADRLGPVLFDMAIRLAAVLLTPVMPASCAEILRRIGVTSDTLRLDRDGCWRNDGGRGSSCRKDRCGRVTTHPRATSASRTGRAGDPACPRPRVSCDRRAAPSTAGATRHRCACHASRSWRGHAYFDRRLHEGRSSSRHVLAAERVPKSKKLLKLHVDVGTEQRTLVAGIAEAYDPESLVGRTVAIVFNLQPATLMGIESNGMVLAASPEGGQPALVSFENPPPPGSRVR